MEDDSEIADAINEGIRCGLQLDQPKVNNNTTARPSNEASPPSNTNSKVLPFASSRPVASGQRNVWDITAKFTNASSALGVGQLIKDDAFTLFESVSAIEIMDPKMDSGYLKPGETLVDEFDAMGALLPTELIWIMDQLLCYEVAWHHGYPLAQTIFTSIHIDKLLWPEPRSVREAHFYRGIRPAKVDPLLEVLRAYCVGLVRNCDNVIQRVLTKEFFEEEDFSTNSYNRTLFTNFDEDLILDALENAIKELKIPPSDRFDADSAANLQAAIQQRLVLRKDMLVATSLETPRSESIPLWDSIRQSLARIENSHHLGQPLPKAFSSKVQRRLASTMPPRPIVQFTMDVAIRKLNQICLDCEEAGRPAEITLSPQQLLSFVWAFNSRKPEPLAFPRACMYSWALEKSPNELEEFLRQDLAETVFPQDVVLDPVNWTVELPRNSLVGRDKRLICAEIVDEFTSKTVVFYYELLSSLCQNRCRTRRMLCHSIINFNSIQENAEVLDEELHKLTSSCLRYPLSKWTKYQKLRSMQCIVQIGFEQDLYLPDELPGMYWWLSQVALERKGLLNELCVFATHRKEDFLMMNRPQQAQRVAEVASFMETQLEEAKATTELAQALGVYFTHLGNLNLLPRKSRPFADPELQFELRMRPFLTMVLPQMLPDFERYQGEITLKSKEPLEYAEVYVKKAEEHLTELKKLGAKKARADVAEDVWCQGVESMIQTCAVIGVNVAAAKEVETDKQSFSTSEAEIPLPGKRYHDFWIVPEIRKK